jgi:hypothetical protein
VNIQADETFSLTSEKLSQSFWEKLRGDYHTESTTTFDGIEAIRAVKDSDFTGTEDEICNRLYISKADYADFKRFYDKNKEKHTTFLFRYQTSDYVSQEATLLKEKEVLWIPTWEEVDTNAYFFKQTVNLDFDIIDVTLSTGVEETVIPVVSKPIDVVSPATPPTQTITDNPWNLKRILKAILVVVCVVILVICGWPLIKMLCGKLLKVFLIPFKRRKRARKKRKEQRKDGEKD